RVHTELNVLDADRRRLWTRCQGLLIIVRKSQRERNVSVLVQQHWEVRKDEEVNIGSIL
ncbi:hypothetical protein CERSUDRAFT_112072, partial [Gelatoporia subvermispora B]